MKVMTIVGARPQFIKAAVVSRVFRQVQSVDEVMVHTGQHYDKKMSGDFFEQLDIPTPDKNLGAGGGSQSEQTASIMLGFEKELLENPADLVIVVGDVTSTMACAIVAQKLHTKVAHVEGGIRSNDWTMPEEIKALLNIMKVQYSKV